MSLSFGPVCNRCVTPLQSKSGRVCSCSCFLCDNCSSILVDKVNNPEGACPGCGKKGVNTIDLNSGAVPLEVSASLSDATSKLESLYEILQFQIKHYRKALDSAHNTIDGLKSKNQSLQDEINGMVRSEKLFFDPEEKAGFYDAGLSGNTAKRPRTTGSSDMISAQISPPSSLPPPSSMHHRYDDWSEKQRAPSSMVAPGGVKGGGPAQWQISPPNRPSTASTSFGAVAPTLDGGRGGAARPSTSPDSPSRRLSPRSRQQEGPRWGGAPSQSTGMTPSSLYSARVQSPLNRFSRSSGGHTPTKGHIQQGGRVRSPYLAIRSPQLRPDTAGSANSLGGRSTSTLVGSRSTIATKEDFLRQRRDSWASREQSKMRREISRFQGQSSVE